MRHLGEWEEKLPGAVKSDRTLKRQQVPPTRLRKNYRAGKVVAPW